MIRKPSAAAIRACAARWHREGEKYTTALRRQSGATAPAPPTAAPATRRPGDPADATGVRALNATALHYAARAGFLETIKVLLEHGADPHARDSHGRTPLDWLDQAAPSVPRAAVQDLLATGHRR